MKRNTGKFVVRFLTLVTVALVVAIGTSVYERTKVHNLTVAAGSPKAESYVMMRALKIVLEKDYPNYRLTVQESGGSAESIARLERGDVQLAPAQADIQTGTSSRLVSVLFQDAFQLLVQKSSGIKTFADLKNKKIALPKLGGQYQSFLFLASQFGLKDSEFTFLGADDDSANVDFASGAADAMFRVRGMPNETVKRFAQGGKTDMVSIDQIAAMHVIQPAYSKIVIPKGAYSGTPPVPAEDLETIGLNRILLARSDVNNEAIRVITEILMTRRQELSAAIPENEAVVRTLVSNIKAPDASLGLASAIHPGAEAFYEGTRTSFVQRNLDGLFFLLLISALVWFWVQALRSVGLARQKTRIREYHNTVVQLIDESRAVTTSHQLEPIRAELLMILTAAVRDLGQEKISEDSFHSFRTIWQVAFDLSSRRLSNEEKQGDFTDERLAGPLEGDPPPVQPWWKFRRGLQPKTVVD